MDTFLSRILFHMLLFFLEFLEFNSSATITFGHKKAPLKAGPKLLMKILFSSFTHPARVIHRFRDS